MKTIGLLGGMSWESTAHYYEAINEMTRARLGGQHSAPIAMVSVDFAPIEACQRSGDWASIAALSAAAARKVEAAGAECLLICANTIHKVAPEIEAAIEIPVIHIADATAARLAEDSITSVGLLGTAYTMEEAFYKDRLRTRHGLKVLVPAADERRLVHEAIYEELCLGELNAETRQAFVKVIEALAAKGAQGVILGCTEIGLLVHQADTNVKLYDTTLIHAQAAVAWALSDDDLR